MLVRGVCRQPRCHWLPLWKPHVLHERRDVQDPCEQRPSAEFPERSGRRHQEVLRVCGEAGRGQQRDLRQGLFGLLHVPPPVIPAER